MKRLLIVAVALALMCGAAFAQDADPAPNDPRVSEVANACYAGGSMEGKCDLDANGDGVLDEIEAEILWSCGWYVIRVEHGLLPASGIPEWCNIGPATLANCYHGPVGSFLYVGPPNAIGNVVFFPTSFDCSGESYKSDNSPLIFADSVEEALELCELLGPVASIHDLPAEGWNTPPGMWGCTLETPKSKSDAAVFQLR